MFSNILKTRNVFIVIQVGWAKTNTVKKNCVKTSYMKDSDEQKKNNERNATWNLIKRKWWPREKRKKMPKLSY